MKVLMLMFLLCCCVGCWSGSKTYIPGCHWGFEGFSGASLYNVHGKEIASYVPDDTKQVCVYGTNFGCQYTETRQEAMNALEQYMKEHPEICTNE